MQASFREQHRAAFDIIYFIGFLILIIVGAIFINAYIFRSFNVVGPSMENTLMPGDRLVVNKIPRSLAQLQNKRYLPKRGQIIVFTNPYFNGGRQDEFIVKRVIGLPGDRVVVKDGLVTVYNAENPEGFNPDELHPGAKTPTEGNANTVVPESEVFVMGDNRVGNNSLDSRNGLGTIPVELIQGDVALRLYPLTDIQIF